MVRCSPAAQCQKVTFRLGFARLVRGSVLGKDRLKTEAKGHSGLFPRINDIGVAPRTAHWIRKRTVAEQDKQGPLLTAR